MFHGNSLLAFCGYIITILEVKVKRVKPSLIPFPYGLMLLRSSHGYSFDGNLGCIAMTGDIYSKHFEASNEVLDFDEELQKLYKSLTAASKAKSEGNPKNRYRQDMPSQTGLPDTRTIIETMCKVNPRARDYFYGTNLSGDWSRDDFIFLLLLRSFTHGNSHLMEGIFLESGLSRLGSKTKRKNDEAYLKYLRASIQKVNQVGNSDFWNYGFKRLTQKEVSL
ncbi:MAG: hypothetical protein ACOX63_14515 [Christensenellales bacterium]